MIKIINQIKNKLKAIGINDCDLLTSLEELKSKAELYENIEKCLYDSDLFLVYKHTDPKGKVYIGITQNHPQTRWNEGGGYEKQGKFYRAIQKYGWINFKHEILSAGLSEEDAKKIENEWILKTKSYDEKYGYNTKVIKPLNNDNKKNKDNNEPKCKPKEKAKKDLIGKQKCSIEISKELIEKYQIKFVNGVIYYKIEDIMFSEKEHPILHKVIINEYNIPLRQHKEIINQVEILSLTEKKNLTNNELLQLCSNDDTVEKWIKDENIQYNSIVDIPTTHLYDLYVKWCSHNKIKIVKGKKIFFKYIEEKYQVEKKQRNDGKRYFVNK